MRFSNSNDNPLDSLDNTRAVLAFLCQSLCWLPTDDWINVNPEALTGLHVVLAACGNTIEEASKRIEDGDTA